MAGRIARAVKRPGSFGAATERQLDALAFGYDGGPVRVGEEAPPPPMEWDPNYGGDDDDDDDDDYDEEEDYDEDEDDEW